MLFFVFFVLWTGLPRLAGLLVELWWFESLGLRGLFTGTLGAQVALGLTGALAMGAWLEANVRFAVRATDDAPPLRLEGVAFDARQLHALAPRLARIGLLLVSLVAGAASASSWQRWLLFRHGGAVGRSEPLFGRDAGFYLFRLPFLNDLHTFLAWAVGLALIGSVGLHLARGGLLDPLGRPAPRRATVRHLAVLAAMLFGVLGFGAWIDAAELLFSERGPVAGASYADVHAALPMLRVEMALAAVGAAAAVYGAARRQARAPLLALGAWLLVHVLGTGVYPGIVHRFTVVPNEAVKEAPFIARNVEATRFAFGLQHVEERDLSADASLSWKDIEANRATIENIRLWDHGPLLDTFAQIQEIRTYYEFASVDNDRYVIGGRLRQTMLSPRELASESLPHRTWINERFTFTHGYGLTLGPVNETTAEGLPVLFVKDIPPVSSVPELKVTRPGIYFGELTSDYVFVGTRAKEFDHPAGEQNVYAAYEGRGGVPIGSFGRKLVFATYLRSFKVLLTEDLTAESRILLHRKVRERVQRLVPFLLLDEDPYMVLREDGTLAWILDGYTASRSFPYAERYRGLFNYLRNSVKVVVDAYDGSVRFYVADPKDPILAAWSRAFPGVFRPLGEMPEDLRAHLRYPEDLFRVQTELFTIYHMTDPDLVYNREDQWEIPVMAQGGRGRPMAPYYTVMRLPGEREAEYILMLPFTPKQKQNLAAWMVARNDGERLGQLVVYRFPRDRLVFGPQQIMNRIQQDPLISRQVSLWDQRGSQVIFGTLLVIPIEESLIYVTPLYLRSEGGRIPELKRVVVARGDAIAMGRTLDEALQRLFSKERAATAEGPSAGDRSGAPSDGAGGEQRSPGTATGAGSGAELPELPEGGWARARALYERALQAQRAGDWAGYGRAIEALGELIERMAPQPEEDGSGRDAAALRESTDPAEGVRSDGGGDAGGSLTPRRRAAEPSRAPAPPAP